VFLIVGLGNPGPQYENTRHNVGFMVIDHLSHKFRIAFEQGEGLFLQASTDWRKHRVVFVKPLTYMNRSGIAVKQAVDYYQIRDYSRLLIILDDLQLPFGTLRMRPRGSDGGQKGLRSIIQFLQTEEIPRLRIGIGDHYTDASDYVLSLFTQEEQHHLPFILDQAAEAVQVFISDGIEKAMNRFNRNVLIDN